MPMPNKKPPANDYPVIIRPDGRRWHLDESREAMDRALDEALERARLWRRMFGADLLESRPRPGLRHKLRKG